MIRAFSRFTIVCLASLATSMLGVGSAAAGTHSLTIITDASWTVDGGGNTSALTCFDWWGTHGQLDAQWIWDAPCSNYGYSDESRTFTTTFEVGRVDAATLRFAIDNYGTARVNGVVVGESVSWHELTTVDITSALTPGMNTLSITAANLEGTEWNPAGLIARIDVDHTPLTAAPASKHQCKEGGWETFNNPPYRNQGDCVSHVATRRH